LNGKSVSYFTIQQARHLAKMTSFSVSFSHIDSSNSCIISYTDKHAFDLTTHVEIKLVIHYSICFNWDVSSKL